MMIPTSTMLHWVLDFIRDNDMSPTELANITGLDRSWCHRFSNGEIPHPNVNYVEHIYRRFNQGKGPQLDNSQ